VYAVGENGIVLHDDGRGWTRVRYKEEPDLVDVWGSSPVDVFAIGLEGTILHFDGIQWDRMTANSTASLRGIWGRAWDDVYAVGEAGTVLHYNGREWRRINTGTDRTLTSVWGIGDLAFAVGGEGTVLRVTPWDARPVDVPTKNPLYDIGGTSATGLYAVGATGTVLRHDGSAWQPVRSGTTRDLSNVCGTQEGHIVVTAGSRLLHFDGREWGFMDVAPNGQGGFVDVYGPSMRSLFVLECQAVQSYDGSLWSTLELLDLWSGDEPGQTLLDIWGSSGSSVYASGDGGTIVHYNGTDWVSATAGMSALESIWGPSENPLLAVSATIDCLPPPPCFDPPCPDPPMFSSILQFDGTTWSEVNVIEHRWIRSIWGKSGDSVFGVGSFVVPVEDELECEHYRAVLRYDGSAWSPMIDETTPGRLNDVWGSSEDNVFAVGSEGAILHYDGSVWAEMTSGTDMDLHAVWGISATDVFAVGASGAILRFDGHAWLPMGGGTAQTLYGVWGSAADAVLAVGEGGTILRFDGSEWKSMPSPTENALYAVWGAGVDDVFAVGQYGTICHYGFR